MNQTISRFSARLRGAAAQTPRPIVAALPQLCLTPVVAAVGLGTGVEWPWVLAIILSLVLVALVQGARAALEFGRRRRTADELLLLGATPRPSSALLSWRAEELTSPRLRSTLARSLRRIEREARGDVRPGPIPLNRSALRRQLGLIGALRARLEDNTRPVSARGMLTVERLLTVPRSPFYSRVPDDVLARTMSDALGALEVDQAEVA